MDAVEKQVELTDEEFVREHWESVRASFYLDSPYTFILVGRSDLDTVQKFHSTHHGFETAWAAAAEFTRERLEEIRQIEREIEILELALPLRLDSIEDHLLAAVEATPRLGRDFTTLFRILKREQDALAALQNGMR
jgi:hypothetical protein